MNRIIYREERKINGATVLFFLFNIDSIKDSIRETYDFISDKSWIYQFSDLGVKGSFLVRAEKTIDYLKEKFMDDSMISSSTGEYIVSVTSNKIIISELKYSEVPLGEVIKEKAVGNPGFDYFSENINEKYIIFGEAKYIKNKSAWSSALSQIVRFINEQKDISDLLAIEKFVSNASAANMMKKLKGYSAGFSFIGNENKLIDTLMKNNNFLELIKYKEIILIGVSFGEK